MPGVPANSIWAREGVIDALRGFLAEGHSAKQTSVLLSEIYGARITKNMVIGKARQQRIAMKSPGRHPRDGDERPGKVRGPAEAAPVKSATGDRRRLTYPRRAIAMAQGLPVDVPFTDPLLNACDRADSPTQLLDLKHDSCRWPFGDPRKPGFHFCGGHRAEGSSYCRRHTLRAMPFGKLILKQEAAE